MYTFSAEVMILILDGNSEKDAHVSCSVIGNFISLRHLNDSSALNNERSPFMYADIGSHLFVKYT